MKHIRMKAADAKAWLAALRSDKYKQGKGSLCTGRGTPHVAYCCMGVLEKVVSGDVEFNGLPSPEWLEKHGVTFFNIEGESVYQIQPYPAIEAYNHNGGQALASWRTVCSPYINQLDGDYRFGSQLDNLNDATDLTFPQLADLIEREIEVTDG